MIRNLKKTGLLLIFLTVLVGGFSANALSQVATPQPPKKVKPAAPAPAPKPAPPDSDDEFPVAVPTFPRRPTPIPDEGGDYERSISVDAKVSVALCVVTGTVKINGSDRNEIRVFVRDGSNVGFNVRAKNGEGKPVLVTITGAVADPKNKHKPKPPQYSSECLWGNDIEIDVPAGTDVTLKAQEATASIDSVRKVLIKNAGGNISLSNVAESVEALTFDGSITVRDARGALNLESAAGNVLVFGVNPGEIGDVLRVKTTSGNIFLQLVGHRQIEASSVSGSIMYSGKFLSGGLYNFSTANGELTLTVPHDSSARVNASYGFGQFDCNVPLKDLNQNSAGRIKSLTAVMGEGDALLKLTTTSGAIKIKRSADKKL